MAEEAKILFAQTVVATTEETAYTVPASTQATVSLLNVCNIGSTARTFAIRIEKSGGTKVALHNGLTINPYDTFERVSGITLGAGDKIYIEASHADVEFLGFGFEITA